MAPVSGAPVAVIRGADVRDASAYSPSFDPSGTAIFFHSGRLGATSLLKASLGRDGSLSQITTVRRDGASNYHVQESPDGSQLAFDSDRDGERGIYVAASDASNPRRVSGSGYAAIPHWSPDGSRLVFVRAEPTHRKVWNLWTTDVATGELTRLTSHSLGQPWGGSWFPDGRRLAYSYEDRLVILDTQTGAERVFASPLRRRLVRTPAVAPDGGAIVFQVYRDGIWALRVADGSMRRILDDRSAEEFAWSPNGAAVAYHSHRNGEWGIWLMASPL
jgi:Tol biopolymer transport system component